jgi:hypothetical protein
MNRWHLIYNLVRNAPIVLGLSCTGGALALLSTSGWVVGELSTTAQVGFFVLSFFAVKLIHDHFAIKHPFLARDLDIPLEEPEETIEISTAKDEPKKGTRALRESDRFMEEFNQRRWQNLRHRHP